MFFKYNSTRHVYREYEKKKGLLIINPKLTQPEFEAQLIALKKERDLNVKIAKYQGIAWWKIALNRLVPILIVIGIIYLSVRY